MNTSSNPASDPKTPRRSARIKAANILKEQQLAADLAEKIKKKSLAKVHARAAKRPENLKRVQITENVQGVEQPRAIEEAQTEGNTQAAKQGAKTKILAAWKIDFAKARDLRRVEEQRAPDIKRTGRKSPRNTIGARDDRAEQRGIQAQHMSHVPLYMSYKKYLDRAEQKNDGCCLTRKVVEKEWQSFCTTKFARWQPDPAVFSAKLRNRRLNEALREI